MEGVGCGRGWTCAGDPEDHKRRMVLLKANLGGGLHCWASYSTPVACVGWAWWVDQPPVLSRDAVRTCGLTDVVQGLLFSVRVPKSTRSWSCSLQQRSGQPFRDRFEPGTASQRQTFVNQAMPHWSRLRRDKSRMVQSGGEVLQRKGEESDCESQHFLLGSS